MLTYEDHDLLAQIASMYYEHEMTQDAIAKKLNLSRVKVYRLLKQARDEQVIQFSITWPVQRDAGLERALCEEFRLREALVQKATSDDAPYALNRLGRLGARLLRQMLEDGMILTVCLGRSTYEVIHSVDPGFEGHVDVAQAVGSLALNMPELDSAALAREMATKLGGKAHYLAAPMVADSAEDAAVMRSQRDIQRVLDMARNADVALVGIGSLDPDESEFAKGGYLTSDDLERIRADGGIGDMAGQIFTLDGEPYAGSFNERVIGIRLDELLMIPTVMAIAIGRDKALAITGALRTGAVDVFCSDAATATTVLEVAGANHSR
jgi:deoxyribonucleoside regulator